MLTRRAFALGLLAAPAVVRAGSLEYVPRGSGLYVPEINWSIFTDPANYRVYMWVENEYGEASVPAVVDMGSAFDITSPPQGRSFIRFKPDS